MAIAVTHNRSPRAEKLPFVASNFASTCSGDSRGSDGATGAELSVVSATPSELMISL